MKRKSPIKSIILQRAITLCLFLIPVSVNAGWADLLDFFKKSSDSGQVVSGLTQNEVVSGLKEALVQGSQIAVNTLGKENGFFSHPHLKIPMPEKLQLVETTLRKLKQDEIADEFVLSMNRAAEKAVPEAMSIFSNAIRAMTINDAYDILKGSDNAATEYLRKTSSGHMKQAFLPIVKQATSRVGVTEQYKRLLASLGSMSNFIDTESLDLDRYVTEKAISGVLALVAKEEKLIRQDPAARTTTLLKKVFSTD